MHDYEDGAGCQTPNAYNENPHTSKRKYSLNEDQRFYDKKQPVLADNLNQLNKRVSYEEADPLTQSSRK